MMFKNSNVELFKIQKFEFEFQSHAIIDQGVLPLANIDIRTRLPREYSLE